MSSLPLQKSELLQDSEERLSCITRGGREWTKVSSCAKILVPECLFQLHVPLNHSFLRAKSVNVITSLSEQFLNSKILRAWDSVNASVIL